MRYSVTFIWDILAKFGVPNLSQSPDIGQNSDGSISDFWVSVESFINKNCNNSRTSQYIDMKLGSVIKLTKGDTSASKKFHDYVMSVNCDVRFMVNLQLSASRIPNGWSIKFTFSLLVTFYLTEHENRTKKPLPQRLYYCSE